MSVLENMPANQQVNKIGKYLAHNIAGAFKLTVSPNTCDVYFILLYQVPTPYQIPGKQSEGYNDVHEMTIDINITTYSNKIRVDTIEVDPKSRTLGFDLFDSKKFHDLKEFRDAIMKKVIKRVAKAYAEYDYLFLDDIVYNQEAYNRYKLQKMDF